MYFGIRAWLGVYFVLLVSATGLEWIDGWVPVEKEVVLGAAVAEQQTRARVYQ